MLARQEYNLEGFVERLMTRSVLSKEEQDAIGELPFRIVRVAANVDFVPLDESPGYCCLIADGLVGRFDENSSGARQITALHIPGGDMPDLFSVVQPNATCALQALTSTSILQVPKSALRAIAADYPAIAEAFWRDCMVDAMILAQWVVNVGRRDARTRIAHLICEMAHRYKVVRDGKVVFQLPMTQAHLGDVTGLTPVHVNRSLKALQEIGVLFRHKMVRIEDWDELVAKADFNSAYLQLGASPQSRAS
jgi:CRP-like cAMP-binding protein